MNFDIDIGNHDPGDFDGPGRNVFASMTEIGDGFSGSSMSSETMNADDDEDPASGKQWELDPNEMNGYCDGNLSVDARRDDLKHDAPMKGNPLVYPAEVQTDDGSSTNMQPDRDGGGHDASGRVGQMKGLFGEMLAADGGLANYGEAANSNGMQLYVQAQDERPGGSMSNLRGRFSRTKRGSISRFSGSFGSKFYKDDEFGVIPGNDGKTWKKLECYPCGQHGHGSSFNDFDIGNYNAAAA